jgi:ADP-heptose:LPS heptosyltransferase
MIIKCHLGLGDAIYSYPVIKELAKKNRVEVMTNYPDVFEPLNVKCIPYGANHDLFLQYTNKRNLKTTQFQDILSSAKIQVSQRINEKYKPDTDLPDKILKSTKKIALVQEPCAAHMDKRNKRMRFAANEKAMQSVIDKMSYTHEFISVGQDEVYSARMRNVETKYINKLSVKDYLYLCQNADFILTGVGHLLPIAQAFNVPYKCILPVGKMPIDVCKLGL